MSLLRPFLRFPATGLVHQGPALAFAEGTDFSHGLCRQIGRIRAHVGAMAALINLLRQLHGLFGREFEGIGSRLLQTGGGKGRGRGCMALGFLAFQHNQRTHGGSLFGQSLVQQIFLPAFQPGLGDPCCTPAISKRQFRAVVGHGHKVLNGPFAFHHQTHSGALHPSGGKSFTGGAGKRPAD